MQIFLCGESFICHEYCEKCGYMFKAADVICATCDAPRPPKAKRRFYLTCNVQAELQRIYAGTTTIHNSALILNKNRYWILGKAWIWS